MQPVPASTGIVDEDAYWLIETNDLLRRVETSPRGVGNGNRLLTEINAGGRQYGNDGQ